MKMPLPHGFSRNAAAGVVAVELGQADVEQHHVGPEGLRQRPALQVRRGPCACRGPGSGASWRGWGPRHGCRPRPGCAAWAAAGRQSDGGSPGRGCAGGHRQADHELAALPGTVAVDPHAAAVHLDQALNPGQPDTQAALGPSRARVDLCEHLEESGLKRRRDADAIVPTETTASRPRGSTISSTRPPAVGVPGTVVEQVPNTWASPVKSASR